MLALAAPANAQTSGDGTAAYQRGDYAAARAIYRRACDGGDMLGCRGLGILYAVGQGVQQDFAQAEALFRQGCRGGDSESCRLAELAKSDKELAASQQSAKSTVPAGHPVTAGGAPCETVAETGHTFPVGTSGKFERYDYKLSNACAVPITVIVYWGKSSSSEIRIEKESSRTWFCTVGFFGNSDCPGGMKEYSVRASQ
jgi:TPR repeat protein